MKAKEDSTKTSLVGGNAAAARMNDALLGEYTQIKELVIKTDRQDVQARYQIAVHCQKVCEGDGRKYGDKAALKLAKAIGWKKSSIYDYANVAKTWPDKKRFDEVSAREDIYGKPLSWTLIVTLANVAAIEYRDKLIGDTLKFGWSVRDLQKKVREGMVDEEDVITTAAPQPKTPRVLAAAENYVAQVTAYKSSAAVFRKHLVQQIEVAEPADLTDAFVDRLEQAREYHREILKHIDECIVRAQERRTSAVRSQDDWNDLTADQDEYERYFGDPDHPKEAIAGSV